MNVTLVVGAAVAALVLAAYAKGYGAGYAAADLKWTREELEEANKALEAFSSPIPSGSDADELLFGSGEDQGSAPDEVST